MAQLLYPASDIETSGWTTTPLWSKLDDEYPGASDEIQSSSNPANVDFEVKLASGTDPGTGKGHRIKLRLRNTANPSVVDYTVSLVEGTTVRSSGVITVTMSDTTLRWFSHKLSEAEANAITDYSDLRIRVSANKISGAALTARVEAAHLEIPDVGSCTTAIPGGIPAANIRVWVAARAMSGLSNNAIPVTLQDESGNGNSLYAAAANRATFKTNIYNGYPVIQFDGVDDQYRMFWPSAPERINYFLVMRHLTLPTAILSTCLISSESEAEGKVLLGCDVGLIVAGQTNYTIEQAGASNHEYYGANTLDTTNFHVLRVRYDTLEKFWDNGVERTDNPGDTEAGSNASIGCKVGSREDNSRWWNGQIAELLVTQGLSDAQELAVEAALQTVYTGNGNGSAANRMGGTGAIRRPPRVR